MNKLAFTLPLALAATSFAQNTDRASVPTGGTTANSISSAGRSTPGGRFIVFTSSATDLVPGDTNNGQDVFVRDRLLQTTTRISVPDPSTGQSQANNTCYLAHTGARVVSDDGRYIVFHSWADNLVIGDTNTVSDVFVHDRDADENGVFDEPGLTATRRVSVSDTEKETMGPCPQGTCGHHSFDGSISADGRFVAFESGADNLTSDSVDFTNIYLRDRDADADGVFDEEDGIPNASTTTLVSSVVSCSGCTYDGFSGDAAISGDGRYIAYVSENSHLVFSDNNFARDIFVWDRLTHVNSRVSVTSSGGEGQINRDSSHPSISYDGRFIAFESLNNGLVSGDSSHRDIFVRDRDVDEDGFFDESGATVTEQVSLGRFGLPFPSTTQLNGDSRRPSISDDGRFVAFDSAATNHSCLLLSCLDENGVEDVFVRDRDANATRRVSLTSSGGEANGTSRNGSISPDGRFVTFASGATDLVGFDFNGTLFDVYVRGFQGQGNDLCTNALLVGDGSYSGDTYGAGTDGDTSCGLATAHDVWFEYVPQCTGIATIDTEHSNLDTVLSVHTGCPGDLVNQIACDDDGGLSALSSKVTIGTVTGNSYWIRVAGYNGGAGYFNLNITCTPCDADWNGDAIINTSDFLAYLNDYNAVQNGGTWTFRNPDLVNPIGVLNTADMLAFLNNFNQGC